MKENRRRRKPLTQHMPVMRHPRSAIHQPITQSLINLDRTLRSIQAYRPRGCQLRLRRKIQTYRNAELALLPVGMLLQLGPAQVRPKINIRRLHRFSRDGADGVRNLVMEESRNALIVRKVSPRTLLIAQPNCSAPNSMPVIAPQSRKIKRMNQAPQRHVSMFSKVLRALSNNVSPLRQTPLAISLRNQNPSPGQQPAQISRNGSMHTLSGTKFRNHRFRPRTKPKWIQGTSSRITYPGGSSLQVKILQQIPMPFQLTRHSTRRQNRTLRINNQLLSRKVHPPTPSPKLPLRNQVQRQLIQQTMELPGGQRRGKTLPRPHPHQACDPFKPCRVF